MKKKIKKFLMKNYKKRKSKTKLKTKTKKRIKKQIKKWKRMTKISKKLQKPSKEKIQMKNLQVLMMIKIKLMFCLLKKFCQTIIYIMNRIILKMKTRKEMIKIEMMWKRKKNQNMKKVFKNKIRM